MELRQGYKLTEVGVVPEDWNTPQLSELTTVMTNGFVGTAKSHYTENENGVLYIQGYNIEENSFNFHGVKYVTEAFHKAHMKSCLRSGDLLTVQTGDVGLTTYVPDFLVGANCHALIISRFDKKQAHPLFVSYYLNSYKGRARLRLIETGTTMKHLNVGDVLEFPVPLPPSIKEQRAIATALSDVDALLDGLDRLIAKKRDIKQAAMQQLLTGKTRLPGFEGEWEEKSLLEIADYQKALFDDGDWVEAEHITDKGIRLIQTGNIGIGEFVEKDARKYIFEESFAKLRCKELRVGDILICRLAEPAGRACLLPDIGEERVITSVDVTIFRPRDEVTDRRFIVQYCSSESWFKSVLDNVGGTTHKRISRGALGKLMVPFPKLDEQVAIADALSDMYAEIEALEKRRAKTADLKQAMMQELLTGRTRLVDSAELKVESESEHG